MQELTAAQIEERHQQLLAQREQLLSALEDAAPNARPVELDQEIGRLTRMDAIQQQHMAQANRRASQVRLQQIESALRRCVGGEYSYCLDCGESIGYPRLEARPETPFCVRCQSQREG